jgi:hypothetical protein
MTEQELEIWKLQRRVQLLERMLLKLMLQFGYSQTRDVRLALQQQISSLQLTDEIVQETFAGLDPAEIALYEGELREIVDGMHAYLRHLADQAAR